MITVCLIVFDDLSSGVIMVGTEMPIHWEHGHWGETLSTKTVNNVMCDVCIILICYLDSSLPRVSVDLTPQSFRSQVLSGQDHWVLDFYAPWCGPCQHFAPEFEVLARVSYFKNVFVIPFVEDYENEPIIQDLRFLPVRKRQHADFQHLHTCVIDRFLKERFEQGR